MGNKASAGHVANADNTTRVRAPSLALHSSTLGLKKQLSESACELLDLFREAHRRPGARVTVTTLDAHIGTDPAVAVASELIRAGYLIAPELTATGFDATQRGNYRNERASEVGR